jgi:hypothetical protein
VVAPAEVTAALVAAAAVPALAIINFDNKKWPSQLGHFCFNLSSAQEGNYRS